jgi:hypothetical protein
MQSWASCHSAISLLGNAFWQASQMKAGLAILVYFQPVQRFLQAQRRREKARQQKAMTENGSKYAPSLGTLWGRGSADLG